MCGSGYNEKKNILKSCSEFKSTETIVKRQIITREKKQGDEGIDLKIRCIKKHGIGSGALAQNHEIDKK